MFKKLKDKLAEEVKSSPQRIQQFAQAAQAAVTSASSSISDITNNDLFSIGDNDNQQNSSKPKPKPVISESSSFQDVSLEQAAVPPSTAESPENSAGYETMGSQRQRRLSNSSFASDVSFRLPNYESPSMYHLQSDMDVSASEAEERGLSSSTVSLDRVTKEQLYSAYRRTQERYTKYRTQYADLARHYKLLERENAKAKSVLVETQDKALRRISELREQCSLEQSAKAHLEKALRVEIDERNMKIEALETKVNILLEKKQDQDISNNIPATDSILDDNNANLINLSNTDKDQTTQSTAEVQALNGKIEKLEQLVNKYKESLKATKDKNSQMTTELQIMKSNLQQKEKEIEERSRLISQLEQAKEEIQNLHDTNEELNNKIKTHDFAEIKEISTLKLDLQKAYDEITDLQTKIAVFTKREEENAISLAENKLSIHKELESKETEIKSLKDSLAASKQEIQSLNIVINDYKASISSLEEDKIKINQSLSELNSAKIKTATLESQLQELSEKCQSLEQFKVKITEEQKCMQLQMKQETAEKLAMKDRNGYLENRNQQLSEENSKKSTQINNLEEELKKNKECNTGMINVSEKDKLIEEINFWKSKYECIETEIQEEREELVKLQSEIEKLLANDELIQQQNVQLNEVISKLKTKHNELQLKFDIENKLKNNITKALHKLLNDLRVMKKTVQITSDELNILKQDCFGFGEDVLRNLNGIIKNCPNEHQSSDKWKEMYNKLSSDKQCIDKELQNMIKKHKLIEEENINLKKETQYLKSVIEEHEKAEFDMQSKVIEMDALLKENTRLATDIQEYKLNCDRIQLSCAEINNKHSNLLLVMEKCEEDKKLLLQNIKDLSNKNRSLEETLDNIRQKLEAANKSIKSLELNKHELIEENDSLKKQYQNINESFENLEGEVGDLRKSHMELESEKDRLNSVISTLENDVNNKNVLEYKHSQTDRSEMEEDINDKLNLLTSELNAIENKYKLVVDENNNLKKDNATINEKLYLINDELILLKEQYTMSKDENKSLNDFYSDLKKKFDLVNNDVDVLNNELRKFEEENTKLNNSNVEHCEKINTLSIEITSLNNKLKQIIDEKNEFESKCSDLSKQIDILNNDLDSLRRKNDASNEEIQSVNKYNSELLQEMKHKENEMNSLNDRLKELEEANIALNSELTEKIEIASQCLDANKESDSLKEENRRLKSDIEGLQTYLTKISKENSQLNDKLREMIATSENCLGRGDADEISTLRSQIQVHDDKITELNRENMLLVEENLELKDQLHSQNYKNHDGRYDSTEMQKKCNTLESSKRNIEQKLDEVEQMNKLLNMNIQQTQQHNEKLKFTNEKLETRLDEALVSLRHLHALQENTELEYLRNILYEYFTGTGNHALTLAKVIAAVVKFDDLQTNTILQKEKERQGFLRQLGLL